jgi:hypothetical protein
MFIRKEGRSRRLFRWKRMNSLPILPLFPFGQIVATLGAIAPLYDLTEVIELRPRSRGGPSAALRLQV